jgi:hypothetical protein
MEKFDGFEYTGKTKEDCEVLLAQVSDMELYLDDLGRVWDENGIYIADAVESPEKGIFQI